MDVLANRGYRHLFLAQLVALLGTGLATIALGLLAYDLAGADAGFVLGAALALKMVAYVLVAPLVTALADRLPRREFLVGMDVLRCGVALMLPFVTEVWQVYVLILVLQAASAAFTPTYQATIPTLLPQEEDYTRALSLSRLTYDLESLISPVLAAALLTLVDYHWLFTGTSVGFAASAFLVLTVVLPKPQAIERHGGATRGIRIYLATPRLRALLWLNLAAAAAGSMVLVNTVVLVRDVFGRADIAVAITFGVFGLGSMAAALTLPRLLANVPDRKVMLTACGALAGMLVLTAALLSLGWLMVLVSWLLLGFGYSLALTPVGRLIRRSAGPADLPTLFAAQFAISHAGWLITYLVAGSLGSVAGMPVTMLILGAITLGGVLQARRAWPADDRETLEHVHDDLDDEHPHLHDAIPHQQGWRHEHAYVIDRIHPRWPANHG
ncbi:MFS transporter [Actinosynnema sp. ALI-1.44]|uniref:MFS transporter n=1 Tax=Actinosynnema sp. ALI-1.44 TaxID=1933779 RepID=UPI00097BBCBA|nr:MFS transporter [Actinosynnema sp. ALI-1.44]ONI81408.1 MFS transporter [Actinosynnema sp. ALI-1.44]